MVDARRLAKQALDGGFWLHFHRRNQYTSMRKKPQHRLTQHQRLPVTIDPGPDANFPGSKLYLSMCLRPGQDVASGAVQPFDAIQHRVRPSRSRPDFLTVAVLEVYREIDVFVYELNFRTSMVSLKPSLGTVRVFDRMTCSTMFTATPQSITQKIKL